MLYDPKWQPPETTTEEWRNIINRAANLIEKEGWCQHKLHQVHRTFFGLGPMKHSYCIVGALQTVASGNYHEALSKLDRVLGHTAIWNDKKGRSRKEVVSKLREIAKA